MVDWCSPATAGSARSDISAYGCKSVSNRLDPGRIRNGLVSDVRLSNFEQFWTPRRPGAAPAHKQGQYLIAQRPAGFTGSRGQPADRNLTVRNLSASRPREAEGGKERALDVGADGQRP